MSGNKVSQQNMALDGTVPPFRILEFPLIWVDLSLFEHVWTWGRSETTLIGKWRWSSSSWDTLFQDQPFFSDISGFGNMAGNRNSWSKLNEAWNKDWITIEWCGKSSENYDNTPSQWGCMHVGIYIYIYPWNWGCLCVDVEIVWNWPRKWDPISLLREAKPHDV